MLTKKYITHVTFAGLSRDSGEKLSDLTNLM